MRKNLLIPIIIACIVVLLIWLFRRITGISFPIWESGGIGLFICIVLMIIFNKSNR